MISSSRLRLDEGYGACTDEVRVERRGKSSPACGEQHCPANPIRSNTDRRGAKAPRLLGVILSDRWLERIGNGAPRQIVALKDKTRLTGLLAYPVYSICNPPCVPGI